MGNGLEAMDSWTAHWQAMNEMVAHGVFPESIEASQELLRLAEPRDPLPGMAHMPSALACLEGGTLPTPLAEGLLGEAASVFNKQIARGANAQRYGDVARDHAAIRDAAMALYKALRDASPHSIEVFLKGQQFARDLFQTLGYQDLDPRKAGGDLRPTTPFMERLEAMATLSNSLEIHFRGLERPGPVSYLVDNGAFAQGWLTLEARKILIMAGKRHGCAKEGPVTQLVRAIWRVATNQGGNCTWAPRVVAALAPWLKTYHALYQEWERLLPGAIDCDPASLERGQALFQEMEELHSAWLGGDYLRGVKS